MSKSDCPIKTPVRVVEPTGFIIDAEDNVILRALYGVGKFNLQVRQLHYTAEAINCHDKFKFALNTIKSTEGASINNLRAIAEQVLKAEKPK